MNSLFSGKTRKGLAAVALAATATLSLAACGSGRQQLELVVDKALGSQAGRLDQLADRSATQVTLDKGFTDALTALKLTPGTIGTAKLTNGALVFPITGGNVTVFKPGTVSPYVIGQIQHQGSGFSLTAGGTKVVDHQPERRPGRLPRLRRRQRERQAGRPGRLRLPLDGRTLKPLQTSDGTATLEGTKVEISPVAAPLLDQTFKTDAVKAGLLVGIAKITVNTTSGK